MPLLIWTQFVLAYAGQLPKRANQKLTNAKAPGKSPHKAVGKEPWLALPVLSSIEPCEAMVLGLVHAGLADGPELDLGFDLVRHRRMSFRR